MQSQPGYVDTALHHAVMPDAGEQCLEPVDRLGEGVPSRLIKPEVTE